MTEEATAYSWREGEDNYIYRGFELPCDVRLPPNTLVRAGCSLHTLLLALTLPGRPKHFASADTHPKDGDAQQAPLVSGAVGAAETPNPSSPSGISREDSSALDGGIE